MNTKRTGFTLLELLIVVAIIAVLIALALPFYQDYVARSKITAAQADLNSYQKALQTYDQMEDTMWKVSSDTRGLIGKYMQDFRATPTQMLPRDPWGNDYFFSATHGVILSRGPNSALDTTAVAIASRTPLIDDLLVTWKPPFMISSAKALGSDTVELVFSRKIDETTWPAGAFNTWIQVKDTTGAVPAGAFTERRRLSATIYRFIHNYAITTPGATVEFIDNTDNTLVPHAEDGRDTFDLRPDGTAGHSASFTPIL